VVNNFWFEAKNINCFKNGFRVIKDLNLKIDYSENVILIGPNGSGKSSLIEIINRNLYPVIANKSKLKIFDKELINLWELRKRISTVNNDIKNRISPNLKVFDLILSGLYGRYCLISKKSKKKVISNEPQGRLISWSPWPPANFQTRYPAFPFVLTILIIVIGQWYLSLVR